MYGNLPLATVLPEVRKCGATVVDLWPPRHGTQRTEADELGHDSLNHLLQVNDTRIALTSRFDLGPYQLIDEIAFARRYRSELIVVSARGRGDLAGSGLKSEIQRFLERMRPTLATAAAANVTVAIENHANSLISTPDSLRWLAELGRDLSIGIAFAPYHLEQDAERLAALIRDVGSKLVLFYAWQHGLGSTEPVSRHDQFQQMPGRGPLDFKPLLRALREIAFNGWTEIFMHPFPRGIPIRPTAPEVTAEINRSRQYLESQLAALT